MKSIASHEPGQPRLSNRLADLAERAGEAARRYRRGSIESIREYLTAGELLAEARGECRRGEWGAFLQRAGIDSRTARRMMQAWRIARETGADAEAIHEAGGLQAFVARAVDAAGAALDAAADALDAGTGEKTVLKTGIEPPAEPSHARIPDDYEQRARRVAAEHDADRERIRGEVEAIAEGVRRQYGRALGGPPLAGAEPPPPAFALEPPTILTPAQRRRAARLARREAGRCVDCGADCAGDGTARCARCRSRIGEADKRRRDDAKLGAVLGRRIRDAARQGRGVRLSAADVAGLVEGERARFAARLAKVGRGSKER